MKVTTLIESIKLNEEYQSFEGGCTKPNFFTWLGIDSLEYFISVPTGIDEQFLQVYICQMSKRMFSISAGIIAEDEKGMLINDRFYKENDNIQELKEYPKILELLENLPTVIKANKGKKSEYEMQLRKRETEEKEKILNGYK